MNFRQGRRRPEVNLDMTPLIDVVFLLLIFFLITTTFARPTQSQTSTSETEAAIELELASGEAGQVVEDPAERLQVLLNERGEIYTEDGERVAPNELKARLLRYEEDGEEAPIVDLKADRDVPYSAVMELLDLIKGSGVNNINLIQQRTTGPSPSPSPSPSP